MRYKLTINHSLGAKIPVELENINGQVHLTCATATLPTVIFSGTERESEVFISGMIATEQLAVNDYIDLTDSRNSFLSE